MITRAIVLDSLKGVRNHTIEIARDIPEDKYAFRAAEGFPTVLELFQAIISITEFMVGSALHPEFIAITPETREEVFARINPTAIAGVQTKAQVTAALESSMKGLVARVEAADEAWLNTTYRAPDTITKVRLWVINCAKEQEMVRRSQLFLVERMIGIIPHTTRAQMAAQAAKKA